MGLRDAMARSAARHAHVLVVETPGWDGTRMAAERAVLDRGWRLARSPADADVLVVCGSPGPTLNEAVDLVWHQMPGPRVRVDIRDRSDVSPALVDAQARLLDEDRHRRDAHDRPEAPDLLDGRRTGDGAGHRGSEDPGAGEAPQRSEDHRNDDHVEGHADHDAHAGHGDMGMSPGGIRLAEGAEDRDGLEMDLLEVRLGPVLPHWPAGLVLHCSLQGDIVTDARAEVVSAADQGGDRVGPRARALDQVVSMLTIAGWDDAAEQARRVRDSSPVSRVGRAGLARLRRRVRRSWPLRWSMRGLGPLTADDVRLLGLPADVAGDAYDRLVGLLARAEAAPPPEDRPGIPVDELAGVVVGLDLAAVRLIIAGLDVGPRRAALGALPEANRG